MSSVCLSQDSINPNKETPLKEESVILHSRGKNYIIPYKEFEKIMQAAAKFMALDSAENDNNVKFEIAGLQVFQDSKEPNFIIFNMKFKFTWLDPNGKAIKTLYITDVMFKVEKNELCSIDKKNSKKKKVVLKDSDI